MSGSPATVQNPFHQFCSLLRRLWRGDISLSKSFWVCGFLVFLVAGTLGREITSGIAQIAFFVIYFLYALIALVGIWRSASKYQGWVLWKVLSMLTVILVSIRLAFGVFVIVYALLSQA